MRFSSTTARAAASLGITVALLAGGTADAATVTSDGSAVQLSAAPGEVNDVSISVDDEGRLTISDVNAPLQASGACTYNAVLELAACPSAPGGITVSLGDGNDVLASLDLSEGHVADGALHADLGAGNDVFRGSSAAEVVDGGAGDDELEARAGNDVLDGGDGTDKVWGGAGSDDVRGGAGDDQLEGDVSNKPSDGADRIDGGTGVDTLDDWYAPEGSNAMVAPIVSVSLDGAANDGVGSEADNVIGVERLVFQRTANFVGDDGPNEVQVPEAASSSRLSGLGGNDRLTGTNDSDALDGGAGDDKLFGGFGDDAITGGPGRDMIEGDRLGRCNEVHCDLTSGGGNDTIEARDGEADSISCGFGTDVVRADAIDTVSIDCETVDRGGQPAPEPQPGPTDPSRPPIANRPSAVVANVRLRAALRRGLKVTLTGVSGKVTVKAKDGRRVVAAGTCTATSGSCTATLRFSKTAKRRLGRRRKVRLSIAAPGVVTRVELRR